MTRVGCMAQREDIRAAIRFLEGVGAKCIDMTVRGSGHIQITWIKDGRDFSAIASSSPKNPGHAGKKICKDMRRAMELASERKRHGRT